MHWVKIRRSYDDETLNEMKDWCNNNCGDDFRPGRSDKAGFYGDQMEFHESAEDPWLFESEEDATLFRLKWL